MSSLTPADVVLVTLRPSYFDQRDRERLERRLVARLEQLGNEVTLERTKEAA